jgi:hypothetical protein
LAPGEVGLNLTTGKIKIGNGEKAWNSLEYFAESAYELAERLGFEGTEQEWLDSLSGYAIALENGFEGTQEEWLLSLVGPPANILAGSVTTGQPGSQAEFEITGTAPDYTVNIVIPEGLQGVQGIQGEVGPIGLTGATGIEWRGLWDSGLDYVNNDAVFYDGASWFAAGDPPVGDIPIESSNYWFPLALQGATGPQGPQGIQGIQGEAGPANALSIGTVISGEDADATITGTSPSQTLNLTLPRGEQGIQGETGSLGNLSVTSPITYDTNTNTLGLDHDSILYINGGSA